MQIKNYKALIENLPLGVFRTTPGADGQFIEVNPAFVHMLGYKDKEELLALKVSDIFQNPAQRKKLNDKIMQYGKVQNEILTLVKKDGSPVIVSETTIGVRDHKNNIICFDGILEDITSRKQVEEELHLYKSYRDELFNSAPEAIVLHDNEDRIADVNKEFTRLFGYTRDEAIGKPINDLLASDEFLDEATKISESVIAGQKIDLESKRKHQDGHLIDVSILGAPIIHDGKQVGDYAIYRDITDKKKAREARIRVEEEARMARDIQMNFLPKINPVLPGYDIIGKSIPASNVGGDYYDFIQLDEHRVAIGLGDVSGNGLPAALVMANLQATIRSQMLFDLSPQDCLKNANKLIYHSTNASTFISLFLGVLDIRNHTLIYANAGQDLPLLFYTDGKIKTLPEVGMALGMKEEVDYKGANLDLDPGSRLLIFSDGIKEAMNEKKEEYGEENIKKQILSDSSNSSQIIIEGLFNRLSVHFGNSLQNDDMTVILISRST